LSDYLAMLSHDAFRFGGGLNKSAAEIYWHLMQASMTVAQLLHRTGRSRATIYRVLKSMSTIADADSGEPVPMVERRGRFWTACPAIDLDRIARLVGTAGVGRSRREQHSRERQLYRKRLADRSCETRVPTESRS